MSNERLANTNVYWPIDEVRDFTIDTIENYYRTHISNDFTLPEGYDHFSHRSDSNQKIQYLKDIGVRAVRYALVMFARFDDEDDIRALPMYSDYESRSNRNVTGSYHSAIVDDYYYHSYDERAEEYGFRSAGGMDVISGEAILLEHAEGPTVYLRVPRGKMLSDQHRDAMTAMSLDFPDAKYAVLTGGMSQYAIFHEGVTEEFPPDFV